MVMFEAAASTVHQMAAEKTNNFLVPNATFVAEVISFLLIMFVIGKYIWPVLSKAMQQRLDMIERQIRESAEAKERLEKAEADYREAIAEARREAAKIREDAAADKARTVEAARVQAQAQVDEMLARAAERIDSERDRAVRSLRVEVGTLAVTLAERIVGVTLEDDARQRQVVDSFLAELESGQSSTSQATGASSGG